MVFYSYNNYVLYAYYISGTQVPSAQNTVVVELSQRRKGMVENNPEKA